MLLGALIGVGLTLAILYALNQDLRFAPRTTVEDAQRTIIALGRQRGRVEDQRDRPAGRSVHGPRIARGSCRTAPRRCRMKCPSKARRRLAQGAALDQLSGAGQLR